jgi:hypothetical protein
MAIAAYIGGNFKWRTALEGNDLVLRMTIGAGRSIAMARGHGFAVNTLSHILGRLVMAIPAGLG